MIENPFKFDLKSVNELRQKIEMNEISIEDLKKLHSYLSSFGLDKAMVSEFKDKGINTFDEFIVEKNKPENRRNSNVDNYLMGFILELTNQLKRYLDK